MLHKFLECLLFNGDYRTIVKDPRASTLFFHYIALRYLISYPPTLIITCISMSSMYNKTFDEVFTKYGLDIACSYELGIFTIA